MPPAPPGRVLNSWFCTLVVRGSSVPVFDELTRSAQPGEGAVSTLCVLPSPPRAGSICLEGRGEGDELTRSPIQVRKP